MNSTPEWDEYVADPNPYALASLMKSAHTMARIQLLTMFEDQFFSSQNWRVAQHVALLHLDVFPPPSGTRDVVKALFFADQACTLSNQDPRARLVMAQVSWARRLPLAILSDVEAVRLGESRLRSELDEKRVNGTIAQAFLLEGLAYAYLKQVDKSFDALKMAESFGVSSPEAFAQLLLAAEPTFPAAGEWAARRLPPTLAFGPRVDARRLHALRRVLIETLRNRCAS